MQVKTVVACVCGIALLSACVSSRESARRAEEASLLAAERADRDDDRIPDRVDQCPDEPESPNDYRDQDGCPDVDPSKVWLPGMVTFEVNRLTPDSKSDETIAEGARLLQIYPKWKLLLEGHADGYGADDYNVSVSLKRAEAVRGRLIEKFGINPARITTAGVGKSKPRTENVNRELRKANRRVDFLFSED